MTCTANTTSDVSPSTICEATTKHRLIAHLCIGTLQSTTGWLDRPGIPLPVAEGGPNLINIVHASKTDALGCLNRRYPFRNLSVNTADPPLHVDESPSNIHRLAQTDYSTRDYQIVVVVLTLTRRYKAVRCHRTSSYTRCWEGCQMCSDFHISYMTSCGGKIRNESEHRQRRRFGL